MNDADCIEAFEEILIILTDLREARKTHPEWFYNSRFLKENMKHRYELLLKRLEHRATELDIATFYKLFNSVKRGYKKMKFVMQEAGQPAKELPKV